MAIPMHGHPRLLQDSMKHYMEQMTKDPAFEQLKQQAEAMLSQEGFMEQMAQAFADIGKSTGDPTKSDPTKSDK